MASPRHERSEPGRVSCCGEPLYFFHQVIHIAEGRIVAPEAQNPSGRERETSDLRKAAVITAQSNSSSSSSTRTGELLRGNCSRCSRKWAVMVAVPHENLTVIKGREQLSTYRWNRGRRGIISLPVAESTHHRRRMAPVQAAFRVACLEGVDARFVDDVT